MIRVTMFRLNRFVVALFASHVGFKHVSCMVVQFMLFYLILWQCSPKYFALYPTLIIAIVFLNRPIYQLDIWPHNSPNFGPFGHLPPLCTHPPF